MSNRQLVIIGSFALACCIILGVAFRSSTTPPPPKSEDAGSIGRYQVVGLPQGESAPHVVVLDTVTGETWQVRLPLDGKDPEKWKTMGTPAARKMLPVAAVSDM